MPYIDNEDKEKYDANKLEHCGILNYAVNQLINDYIEQNGKCYQTFNDITGALENALLNTTPSSAKLFIVGISAPPLVYKFI